MNPVLATTSEFDYYINSRLKPKVSDNQKSDISSQRPKSSASGSRPPISKQDTSASQTFLELNTKKYVLSEHKSNKHTAKTDIVSDDEFDDPLAKGHSWRGHLTSKRDISPGHVRIPTSAYSDSNNGLIQSKSSLTVDINAALAVPKRPPTAGDRSPLPNPPLSYSKQTVPTSLHSQQHNRRSPRDPTSGSIMSSWFHDLTINNNNQTDSNMRASNQALYSHSPSKHNNSSQNQVSSKVRWVLLERYLHAWQVEAKLSRGLLVAKSKIVTRSIGDGSRPLLRVAFRDWWKLYLAQAFSRRYTRYQAKLALRKWNKTLNEKRLLQIRATRYRFQHIIRHSIDMLLLNVRYCRRMQKNEKMLNTALRFCKQVLLNRVMALWKLYIRKLKGEREIGEEQNKRREKIQQFMNNITARKEGSVKMNESSVPPLQSVEGLENSSVNRTALSTPRVNAAAVSTASDRKASGPIRADSKSTVSNARIGMQSNRAASAGRTRPPLATQNSTTNSNSNASVSTVRSGSAMRPTSAVNSSRSSTATSSSGRFAQSANTTKSKVSNHTATLGNRNNTSTTNEITSSKQVRNVPPAANNNTNHEYRQGAHEVYSEDEFEVYDDPDLTPPPSYNAIVNGSMGGGSEGFQKDNGERSSKQWESQNNNHSSGGGSDRYSNNNKWVDGGGNINSQSSNHMSGPHMQQTQPTPKRELSSFEQRAFERREKLQVLKRQAEERVSQRQQEELNKQREKAQHEAEEAEKIRQNARLRLESTKLASARTAELNEEQKRQLNRAKVFRRRQVLIQYGFAPWRRFIEQIKLDEQKASNFYADSLLQAAWSALVGYIVTVRTERIRREHRQTSIAIAHYRRKLLKSMWKLWRMFHKVLKAKATAITGHFSRYTLCRRSFQGWKIAYERTLREAARKIRSVEPRGNKITMKYYWTVWKKYLENSLFDREIRIRADYKWATVQSWLKK